MPITISNANQNGTTMSSYLIESGAALSTGQIPVFGMNSFSFLMEGITTGAANAFGSVSLDARITRDGSWSTLKTVNFTNSSGELYFLNASVESLRGRITQISSGVFNIGFCAKG